MGSCASRKPCKQTKRKGRRKRARWINPLDRPIGTFAVVRKQPWFKKLVRNYLIRLAMSPEGHPGLPYKKSSDVERYIYRQLKAAETEREISLRIKAEEKARKVSKSQPVTSYKKPKIGFRDKIANFFGFSHREKKYRSSQ